MTLEERLDRSARNTFERVTPQLRVTSSGEQWFDLEVRYTGTGGEQFSAADIQRLVLGSGSARLKNGKIALIDGGAVEELQEVLLDCAPQQQVSTEGTRYRMGPEQAGFLEASLGAQGLKLAAPLAWREKAARQTGEATLTCPPLGSLEGVLRPYQKQGVAWLRFLRESGFCGVLADEMGLGKRCKCSPTLRSFGGSRAQPAGSLSSSCAQRRWSSTGWQRRLDLCRTSAFWFSVARVGRVDLTGSPRQISW